MFVQGYIVRETEAAVAFVTFNESEKTGVRPLWVPRKKIAQAVELDLLSKKIQTAQDGERIGIPQTLDIDEEFAKKVKLAIQ